MFHRHRRHRRGVRYLVRDRMEFTGARRCYTVPLFHPCAGPDPPGGQLGWSRGGSEAPGATKPAATSMRTGTSTTREYQRNHARRYADGTAPPVSEPPPPPSPPPLSPRGGRAERSCPGGRTDRRDHLQASCQHGTGDPRVRSTQRTLARPGRRPGGDGVAGQHPSATWVNDDPGRLCGSCIWIARSIDFSSARVIGCLTSDR